MCQYTNGGERVNYFEFLAAREQLPDMGGFIPGELPSHLFDYQAQIVGLTSTRVPGPGQL